MRKGLTVAAVALLMTAGCAGLVYEKTFDVPTGGWAEASFDAPTYSQTVKVTIEPDSTAISAYLVKASDASAVKKQLEAGKEPDKALVMAGKTHAAGAKQDITLETTVPAKTAYTLILNGGSKDAKVKVKLVGK